MLHGVGTDILHFSRMGALPEDDAFVRRCFTEKERAEIFARDDPQRCLCTRFAGKEAVFKALKMPPDAARLDEIEILSDENGAPCVTLLGSMARFAEGAGVVRVQLSLSWETEYAVAFAVSEGADAPAEKETGV